MPSFRKGSPAIRRLISRTLKLHNQPCYPPNDYSPDGRKYPAPVEYANSRAPYTNPITNTDKSILHTLYASMPPLPTE